MKKNVPSQNISAVLLSLTDGSPVTTGSPRVYITGDNGTQSVGVGVITHKGVGLWTYRPSQAETNFDHISFLFDVFGAIPVNVQLYTTFPQSADINVDPRIANLDAAVSSRNSVTPNTIAPDNAGIAANGVAIGNLNDFNPATDTVANVTLVDTVTTNTDMRGTDGANTTTPPTASDIAMAVWVNTTRSLTTFGSLATSVATAVWGSATRTLTSVADSSGVTTLLSRIASALTITGGAVTVGTNNDKTGYSISGTKTTLDALNDVSAADVDSELSTNHGAGSWEGGAAGTVDANIVSVGGVTTTDVDDFKADVSNLDVAVSTRSTFDPALDTVANVTNVANNTDMRGTDGANTIAPDNAGISANGVAIGNLNDFNPATDVVANVSLVDVVTTNTDMRGTDGANTISPDNAGITANNVAINALNDFNPATDVVANVALVDVVTTNTDMRGTDGANTTTPPTETDIANAVWNKTLP